MSKYYNVTGSTGVTVELIAPTATNAGIKSILLTNVHATADATVTLFIQDDPASGTTRTYNIIHTIAIPADSSLFLDRLILTTYMQANGHVYVSILHLNR